MRKQSRLMLVVLAMVLAVPASADRRDSRNRTFLAETLAEGYQLVPDVFVQACQSHAICSQSVERISETSCVPEIQDPCLDPPNCWNPGLRRYYAVTCWRDEHVYNWYDLEECKWHRDVQAVDGLACAPDPNFDLLCNTRAGAGSVYRNLEVLSRQFVRCP